MSKSLIISFNTCQWKVSVEINGKVLDNFIRYLSVEFFSENSQWKLISKSLIISFNVSPCLNFPLLAIIINHIYHSINMKVFSCQYEICLFQEFSVFCSDQESKILHKRWFSRQQNCSSESRHPNFMRIFIVSWKSH